MEGEEACDDYSECDWEYVWCYNIVAHAVVDGLGVEHSVHKRPGGQHYEPIWHCAVEKHVHKVLVVEETDAVRHPGTVVIHL